MTLWPVSGWLIGLVYRGLGFPLRGYITIQRLYTRNLDTQAKINKHKIQTNSNLYMSQIHRYRAKISPGQIEQQLHNSNFVFFTRAKDNIHFI